jgi:hypothetical protein
LKSKSSAMRSRVKFCRELEMIDRLASIVEERRSQQTCT